MLVKPAEIEAAFSNPWMGWGLWAGPIYFDGTPRSLEENTLAFGDEAPLFQWVLLDWMWADLEPEQGRFAWDELDDIIQYWAERGKQINLRVWVTDDPGWNGAAGAARTCPDWAYGAGLRWHAYTGEAGSAKREPDYADASFQSVFMPRLKNLLEALAERYDRPGHAFNFISNMGYGQWGEWHTMWSNYHWPSKQVKHDVLAQIVNLYADTFRHIDLAISYCFDTFNIGPAQPPIRQDPQEFHRRLALDDPEDFKYRQALDVALERGYLLGRHGFIDGLNHTDRAILREEWRRRAFYAEANWSYLDVKEHGTHGSFDENIDVMLEWHSNYAHFYTDAASYRRMIRDDLSSLERGLQSGGLGYRLVLCEAAYPDQLAPGALLVLYQKWANRNVGRCYKRYPLQVSLVDERGQAAFSAMDLGFDQTGWVQGETYELRSMFQLPKDISPGMYDLRIALVDWQGLPQIRLGIAGEDGNKRYQIGKIRIV